LGSIFLHIASKQGVHELIKCLVDLGADPCLESKVGLDAFLVACLDQKLVLLRRLLDCNGESSSQKTLEVWTPLHLAALEGKQGVVDILLSNGPLQFAAMAGNAEIARLIL
ncbi:uncharacterized protein GLRG_07972, partial [Colletotrichum graminicola M1.001]